MKPGHRPQGSRTTCRSARRAAETDRYDGERIAHNINIWRTARSLAQRAASGGFHGKDLLADGMRLRGGCDICRERWCTSVRPRACEQAQSLAATFVAVVATPGDEVV